MSRIAEAAADMAKAAPPATVAGMTVAGIHLSDLVLIVTLIYTLMQTVLTVPRLVKMYRDWRNGT